MAEIRYGIREGDGKGREYPVAASQVFYRRGGKFVYMDSTGAVTLADCTAATTVMGWAVTPKDDSGQAYWTSSSTAKTDRVFVIYDLANGVFEMPCSDTSLTATNVGQGAAIVTSSGMQYADIGNSASVEMLTVVDFDDTNDTVFVKVKPKYWENV